MSIGVDGRSKNPEQPNSRGHPSHIPLENVAAARGSLLNITDVATTSTFTPTKPLALIHITKTAGTSLEQIATRNGMRWGKVNNDEYGFWHDPFIIKPPELKEKYDWFLVVRDPYDRIMSEFHCGFGGVGKKAGLYNASSMNRYVASQVMRYVGKEGYKMSGKPGHWVPMSSYVDGAYPTWVLHFETLAEEFATLVRLYYGTGAAAAWSLEGRTHVYSAAKQFTANDLTEETLALINDVYRDDFELFQYPMRHKPSQ